MLLFRIVLGIIFIISLMLYIIFLSILEIEFKELKFNSNNNKNNKLENYLIYIRLKFANKITWLKIKMDYKKMEKYKIFNNKILGKLINIRDLLPLLIEKKEESLKNKNFEKLDIKIKKINLNIKISALNAMLTALVTAIISTFLSIIIANRKENNNITNYKYKIIPIYSNKAEISINLNCIINVKMVHIIHIVYMLYKKKRSVENDERTSNRRSYVCSND